MTQPVPRFIAPAIVVFAVSAVTLAGFGGMMIGARIYALFGAGALFCLLMLLVFEMVLSGLVSDASRYALAAGQGALTGACSSLFFFPGSGFISLLGLTAAGAAISIIIHWARELRSAMISGS